MTLTSTPTRSLWNHLNHVAHELDPGHTSHTIRTTWGCVTTTNRGIVTLWADPNPIRAQRAHQLQTHLPHLTGLTTASTIGCALATITAPSWITLAALTLAATLHQLQTRLPTGYELRDRDTALVTLLEHHPAPDEPTWPTTALPAPAITAIATTITTGHKPNGAPWTLHQPGARAALDELLRAMHEVHRSSGGAVDDDLIHLAHDLPDTIAGMTRARARLIH